MEVYIEQNFGKFVVCRTCYNRRSNRVAKTKSGGGRNIFGEEIPTWNYDVTKYETVICAGEALSTGYITESEAKTFIKQNNMTETYGPHTVVSVEL